ncbi:hypothetical protein [Halorussus ruber]|uniref:hypothetical protein n=1 Tax=Halorussus ruber TaxID=1126238 RepID=UPI0010932483|nr:hypothetical protein [Halorussus ruber]
MTADEYDIGGITSPTDRTRSGDSPVVGGEAGNGAASTPSERFDADRGGDDRQIRGFGTVAETPSSTDTEEPLYV